MIDKDGNNAINVILGASGNLTITDLKKHIKYAENSKIFLTQLEISNELS